MHNGTHAAQLHNQYLFKGEVHSRNNITIT